MLDLRPVLRVVTAVSSDFLAAYGGEGVDEGERE